LILYYRWPRSCGYCCLWVVKRCWKIICGFWSRSSSRIII